LSPKALIGDYIKILLQGVTMCLGCPVFLQKLFEVYINLMYNAIMLTAQTIKRELEKVFNTRQSTALSKVIVEAHDELVKADDFNELKGIVKELAEAQKETQRELKELSAEVKGLSTEVKELSIEVKGLSREVRGLARSLKDTNTQIGGLGKTMGYSLENEAYRILPAYFKDRYGIEITDKFIRTEISGEEVNIFGIGRRDGGKVLIVGEAELKLSSVSKFNQLDRKVDAVRGEYKEGDIVKVLLTHYASPNIIEKAKEKGIIVIQSFEWY